ncbi:cytidylate kinase [Alkalispirochaeta americana]|uniref:Cytidylate kinase n=1 Tax=Alkalispirochaeta americana TaxID=159291 RepID=A0A1N6UYP4_9SPIO|nr:AAA family ATPase [Alkalispirochaeta americana]SIQ70642.1 cytidylate kinase [Alkalispirochaeta americana]
MKPLRIAISGKSGCGNTTVSRLLAETLQVELVNYTFHTMAEEEGVSFEEMCRRAESDESWDRLLDQRQVERAQAQSCVLASRLAIWLLQEADLKVYLWASPEVRSARIHQREGGDLEAVQAATRERDRRDHARYVRLYNIDIDSWDFADLVVDTEQYKPEEILPLIMEALEHKRSCE